MNESSRQGYDGRAVANFVLDYCDQCGRPVTNLSLQKIVYFCHAWSLTTLSMPLVRHKFEAWKHGPVLQYLYREFREYDDRPIQARARRIDPATGTKVKVEYRFDSQTLRLLRQVVEFYSRLSAYDLVILTHVERGPWDKVWNHGGTVNPGMKIDDDEIARFYATISAPFVAQ